MIERRRFDTPAVVLDNEYMEAIERPAVGSADWYAALRSTSTPTLRELRLRAYGVGEYVGQEGFTTATEMLALARAAGVGRGTRVLDLCCGSGEPGLYLVQETGCHLVGMDLCEPGLRQAQRQAASARLPGSAHFLVADATRNPLESQFDVVLLLETALAFQDKPRLLRDIGRLLRPQGRLALTLEEGFPLSDEERRGVPGGEGIWLVESRPFLAVVESLGFRVKHCEDHTSAHARLARRLASAFQQHRDRLTAEFGVALCDDLVVAHARWAEWLTTRRVRKLTLIAEYTGLL